MRNYEKNSSWEALLEALVNPPISGEGCEDFKLGSIAGFLKVAKMNGGLQLTAQECAALDAAIMRGQGLTEEEMQQEAASHESEREVSEARRFIAGLVSKLDEQSTAEMREKIQISKQNN